MLTLSFFSHSAQSTAGEKLGVQPQLWKSKRPGAASSPADVRNVPPRLLNAPWPVSSLLPSRETANCRTKAVAADTRRSRRRRRTWRCSGGESSDLSSLIKLCSRCPDKPLSHYPISVQSLSFELCFRFFILQACNERAAGNREGLCGGATLCAAGVRLNHGKLPCFLFLLWVFFFFCMLYLFLLWLQGYASEMENPTMSHLIPAPLQNKKEVLFGNMPEIYHFHKR